MKHAQPIPDNIIHQNLSTEKIKGGPENDHLIHHRDLSMDSPASIGLVGFAGDDILEGSVPNVGQIHMFAATGDDWMTLDVTKVTSARGMQGHHAYGGHGLDTFQFVNIDKNASPIVGRLDDFDPTSDRILIEGTEINLSALPQRMTLENGDRVEVRVIEIEHPEYIAEDLGSQYFLAIGDNIFYALDGARDLANGDSGDTGEERHFLLPDALETLRAAETVQYENPHNFVSRDFFEHREDELNLNSNPTGATVVADTGSKSAAHMYGGKTNPHADSSNGQQIMRGSDGDDVIDGNSGNDTIFGGNGNDLIAGGIDNDVLHGGTGHDLIWGGDGADTIFGDSGNDYLHGGRGDDFLSGGQGNDTLFGGQGNDTLVGGGGDQAVNRFHFYEDGGEDTIVDFKVGLDLITLQDDIDPLSVELYENDAGNTVLNYGETGSVELRGVALKDFKTAAELRAEDENPIITITTDPEEEMLQELRVENGYYGNAAPPDLKVAGVEYGAAAFEETEGGGHSYVSEREGTERLDTYSEQDHPRNLTIDLPDERHEEDEEEEKAEDREQDVDVGTCFVATAAYRDPWHPDVVFLRAFRDQWLIKRAWGRSFISFYWRVGPVMAGPVRRNTRLGRYFKTLISWIVTLLRKAWVPGMP